jgi:hypothetical protein
MSSGETSSEAQPSTPVVGAALADRVLEDRRVRGETGDRELGDVARERAVVEHLARDVVDPQALPEVVQALCVGVHEEVS